MSETVRLYFMWHSMEPDAEQYKPLKPQLLPVAVWVAIDVPADLVEVVAGEGKEQDSSFPPQQVSYILTVEGMEYVRNVLLSRKSNDQDAEFGDDNGDWDNSYDEAEDDEWEDDSETSEEDWDDDGWDEGEDDWD